MVMMKALKEHPVGIAVNLAIALILLLDVVWFPFGIAFGMLYEIPILLSFLSSKKDHAILVCLLCTGLTILGGYFSPNFGFNQPFGLFNRAISIANIWTLTFVLSRIRHGRGF